MTRAHRHELAYPALWKAVTGQIRDAMVVHPDIQIPEKRIASVTKRIVGQVLALAAGSGQPGETDGAITLLTSSEVALRPASGPGVCCTPGPAA